MSGVEFCPAGAGRQVNWLRGLPRQGGERPALLAFSQTGQLIEAVATFLSFQIQVVAHPSAPIDHSARATSKILFLESTVLFLNYAVEDGEQYFQ
jgi:hypothetical protein